ncbi:MAG TPA: YbjN domain-containing protein [Pyrinomonadaceae bacterium]|nr:YbjN domain-containing protein [Pyrinomonadaceae bacterium]
MSIADVRNLVSGVIDRFGGDSYESRVDKNTWRIKVGSAGGFIVLFENQNDADSSDLMVFFPLMRVPLAKSLPFYRRLLEMNRGLLGKAAFAVDEDNVVSLLAGRKIFGLDPNELADLMLRTATLADHYDDVLLDEFGRENALA